MTIHRKLGNGTVNTLYDRYERLGEAPRGWRWQPRTWGYQVLRCPRWSHVRRRQPYLLAIGKYRD